MGEVEEPQTPRSTPPGSLRIGSFVGIPVLLQPSWIVLAAVLTLILADQPQILDLDMGKWRYLVAFLYIVTLYVTLFVHEVSHALMARRLGTPVRFISLTFLGGMTALERDSDSPSDNAKIAVVGPLASLAVGAVFVGLTYLNFGGLLGVLIEGLAWSNVVIGIINLIPGFPLDGGRILQALVWRQTGSAERGLLIAGQVGRAIAILTVIVALIVFVPQWRVNTPQILSCAVIAGFVWLGSSAAIRRARVRTRLPDLQCRPLARPVIAVPGDISIAEAVRRASESHAGGIVTHASGDELTGIVSESALLSVPEEKRPWQPISMVARRIEDGLVLSADIGGQDLVDAIQRMPAEEYLLVEADHRIAGVLAMRDVERAYQAGPRQDEKK